MLVDEEHLSRLLHTTATTTTPKTMKTGRHVIAVTTATTTTLTMIKATMEKTKKLVLYFVAERIS